MCKMPHVMVPQNSLVFCQSVSGRQVTDGNMCHFFQNGSETLVYAVKNYWHIDLLISTPVTIISCCSKPCPPDEL